MSAEGYSGIDWTTGATGAGGGFKPTAPQRPSIMGTNGRDPSIPLMPEGWKPHSQGMPPQQPAPIPTQAPVQYAPPEYSQQTVQIPVVNQQAPSYMMPTTSATPSYATPTYAAPTVSYSMPSPATLTYSAPQPTPPMTYQMAVYKPLSQSQQPYAYPAPQYLQTQPEPQPLTSYVQQPIQSVYAVQQQPVRYVPALNHISPHIVQVPGPERIVHIPGPERIVEIPGPERIVQIPGPVRKVEVERVQGTRLPHPQRRGDAYVDAVESRKDDGYQYEVRKSENSGDGGKDWFKDFGTRGNPLPNSLSPQNWHCLEKIQT